jgi:uracil-DNA glycosylase
MSPAIPDVPAIPSSAVATLAEIEQQALGCVRCPLAKGRTTVVFGEGAPDADVLVVGEGPGRDEDLQGRPFVGRSGKLLDRLLLEELGMARSACYIANVVKCRPPGNRDPRPDEIEACRPWLEAQVALIRPKVVITLGNFATKLLLNTTDGIRQTRGRVYPSGPGGARLVPTYHPAAALRSGGEVLAEMRADFVRAKEALGAAKIAGPDRISVAPAVGQTGSSTAK